MSFLSEKYSEALSEYNKNKHEIIAEVIEKALIHVNNKYNDMDKLAKISACYLVAELWNIKLSIPMTMVNTLVDRFIQIYNSEFEQYKSQHDDKNIEDIHKQYVDEYIKNKRYNG